MDLVFLLSENFFYIFLSNFTFIMHIYNLKVVLKLKAMQITQNYGKKKNIFLIETYLFILLYERIRKLFFLVFVQIVQKMWFLVTLAPPGLSPFTEKT